MGLTTACCCYLYRPQSQIFDDDYGKEDNHDHDHDDNNGDDDDDAVVISAAHALGLWLKTAIPVVPSGPVKVFIDVI